MQASGGVRILVIVALAMLMATGFVLTPASARETVPRSTATVMITLYGNMASPNGWGFGPQNISNPGPTVTVNQGDSAMFHLFSGDGLTHTLVIDLDASNTQTAGDWVSEPFNASGTGYFTASAPGTFTYFCGMHELSMQWGSIVVRPAAAASNDPVLFAGGGIALVALVGVAVYRWRHIPVPRKALRKDDRSRNGRKSRGKNNGRTRHRSGH